MFRNRVYYRIKPAIPRSLRLSIRRWFALRQRARVADIWPIAPGSQQPPQNWAGWPGGKKFALVLTHDVESQYGLDKCRQLMKLEKSLDFRSSFNFIPKGGYEVPEQLRNELVRNGYEVGVHDLRHDGKLYHTRAEFSRNAALINEYLRDWQAVGFRSGFMLHNLNWLHDLNIEYDASTFDTDPFEPQPDHRNTIFPFWIAAPSDSQNPRGGYVEMPYTLPQDSTLFLLFREKSTEVWLRKLDWIAQHGGMVLLNTHPDYINFENKRSGREYPAAFYQDLLEYICSKYRDQYWHASPRDVASYVRADARAAATITQSAARSATVNAQPAVATKVWVDLDNTPHVPFFEPLMREFRARGYDVLCTARDAFQVCDLARQRGVEFQQVGRHSGKNRIRKAVGLFYRALQLLPLALREKPAIAISHGSRAQIIACKLLNIPSVLIEDYEHADYPPSMRPRWEIVPESIGDEGLCCAPDHARRYPGIKEHVYVRNFRPDAAVLTQLGLKEQHLIVTVRPPATEAHYHTDRGESLFFEMMAFLLNDPRVRVVLMPRNGKQADWIRQNKPGWFSNSRVVIPNGPMDGLNVIFHSDLVVSGGGTMNREAAALGVPAYSILAGKVGAVDRALERNGQLTMVTSAKDFVQKIKLVRRPRPLKLPIYGAGAFESIMTHIEEILSLEHAVKSIRRALPAGSPSAEAGAVRVAS